MPSSVFDNPFFHQEPAHPGAIKLHDDLVNIYKIVRESYQEALNATFDKLARQIGFVVMTTVPVTLTVGKEGGVSLAGENFRGTIFEESFLEVLKDLPRRAQDKKVAPGTYRLYLVWYDALKLKLHTDWMEPAHWLEPAHLAPGLGEAQIPQRRPGPIEPAHWFDPGFRLELEESLVISAIDEVYPELRLADRVRIARQAPRAGAVTPGIREPAHFRQLLERASQVAPSPGIREPAHFREILERFDAPTLDSVVAVLQALQKLR